jgi:hypothetical protein
LPRGQKVRNLPKEATQIHCILFCRTAKDLGICQQKQLKLTALCSVAQRKISEPRTRARYFVRPPQRKFLEFTIKSKTLFSAVQRQFLELSTKATHIGLFCLAAKFF